MASAHEYIYALCKTYVMFMENYSSLGIKWAVPVCKI